MDSLSETFQALADPTRRAILARLARGEASVSELSEPFDMSLPAVSKWSQSSDAAVAIGAAWSADCSPASPAATRVMPIL